MDGVDDDLIDRNVSDIPLKRTQTFQDFDPVDPQSLTPSPSSRAKLSDIDIKEFFSKQEFNPNKIDPLTAVTVLHYLVQLLIIRCESEISADDSATSLSSDLPSPPLDPNEVVDECPLSPRKNSPPGSSAVAKNSTHYLENTPEDSDGTSNHAIHNKQLQNKMLAKRFSLKSNPPVTVAEYLERINHYCGLSSAAYLASALYLYQVVIVNGALKLHDRNVHRILIAALRISCKTVEDINHRQTFMAKIGGVNNEDLLNLEIGLLYLLNFKCQATEESLTTFLTDLKVLHETQVVA